MKFKKLHQVLYKLENSPNSLCIGIITIKDTKLRGKSASHRYLEKQPIYADQTLVLVRQCSRVTGECSEDSGTGGVFNS